MSEFADIVGKIKTGLKIGIDSFYVSVVLFLRTGARR